ncbi:MAG: ankyrin repeat domain-containing protein, partial [Spirochaetaceae bacterium]|nr:ankyrin repeat domain-containing protein [Spirochaetaceae bacterium]
PDESLLEYGARYEREVYDMVKVFLDAGADPNFKGNPGGRILLIATDWNYKRYFKKNGWLPINYAIEENAFTIVDLLLEHGSTLDETSLRNAEIASTAVNDTAMLDYIRAKMKEKGLL